MAWALVRLRVWHLVGLAVLILALATHCGESGL
jgi:hypothetical protein